MTERQILRSEGKKEGFKLNVQYLCHDKLLLAGWHHWWIMASASPPFLPRNLTFRFGSNEDWLCASQSTVRVIQRGELQILCHCARKEPDLETSLQRAVLTRLWSKIGLSFWDGMKFDPFVNDKQKLHCPHDRSLCMVGDSSKFLSSYKANKINSR